MANKQNLTNAGKGRRKGSKNKFTTLKSAFLESFQELDGVQGLTEWGKTNKTAFYQLLARLLPAENKIGFPDDVKVNWSLILSAYSKTKQDSK